MRPADLVLAALVLGVPAIAVAKPTVIQVDVDHANHHRYTDDALPLIVPDPPVPPAVVIVGDLANSCDPGIFLLAPPVKPGMWVIRGEGLFETEVFGILVVEDSGVVEGAIPWLAGGLLGAAAMFVMLRRRGHAIGELV